MATRGILGGNVAALGPQAFVYEDSATNPSKTLWVGAPAQAATSDPFGVVDFMDDFIGIVTGATAWIATQAVSGTVAAGSLHGGVAVLNAGATTANQGEQIQKAGGCFIPQAAKHIWCEMRLQVNVIQGQWFFGLADIDTTVIASGAIHATDLIGFKCLTSDAVMLPMTGSGGTYTTGAAVKTLVAATFVRLGFVVTSNTSVQFYVDGVATGAAITTNIPSVVVTPTIVAQAGTGAGSNPTVSIDYFAVTMMR